MERCKTCRWWDIENEIAKMTNAKPCDYPGMAVPCIHASEHYQGEMLIDFESFAPMKPDFTAQVIHGDSWEKEWKRLWTGPEFGCVHWQAKEGSDG